MNTQEVVHAITIDGPAGSGKSTLGGELSQQLGLLYFDTGIMYRSLTVAALRHQVDVTSTPDMTRLAEQLDLRIVPPMIADGRHNTVLLEGDDITWETRSPEVESNVSKAARHAGVREIMVARQREIAMRGNAVVIGRDAGTRILPEALLKIYLVAEASTRAIRRVKDSQTGDEDTIRNEIIRRDLADAHVMSPAPDAIHLSTDNVTVVEEAALVMQYWAERVNPIKLRRVS